MNRKEPELAKLLRRLKSTPVLNNKKSSPVFLVCLTLAVILFKVQAKTLIFLPLQTYEKKIPVHIYNSLI